MVRKILSTIVVCLIFFLVAINFGNVVSAADTPLQISPFHTNGNSPCGVFYSPAPKSFTYSGGVVWLSSLQNGTGEIYTDDKLDIEVTRPDGTKATFSKDYGNGTTIVPTAPQNVTTLFKVGSNSVKVTMTDLRSPFCNSSEYWLVETTSGGGNLPAKPNILPRSTWHGDNSGAIISQTPKRIAIHHAAGTNDPGNIGTSLRELGLALKLKPLETIKKAFNAPAVLSAYDSNYSSIRNSWEGQIFLDWLEHKYTSDFGIDDIAYSYLIAPDGKIYEGRYKGSLAEGAENRGSSVWHANTGLVGIAVLGRYGIDTKKESPAVVAVADGGVNEPTDASIKSMKSLVNWLAGKYNISKNGQTKLPPDVEGVESCIRSQSTNECNIDNIAGHKDYDFPTNNISDSLNDTACPGDNLSKFIPTLKEQASFQASGSILPHKSPKGLLIGGFSPINLGVVDPNGQRLGVDPTTGQFVVNIPEGVQGRMLLGDESTQNPFVLQIPSPVSGVYKIDVVGTGTGSFTLAAEDLQSSSAMAYAGNTTNGKKDNYQVIYSTSNPSNIELFHDTVPPVTTGTMTCSRDMLGICRSEATVKLQATDTGTDGDPASGVDKIECSYDNKVTWQQCGNVTGGQIVFDKNGKVSFWYRSTDRVLNVEAPKFSGIIDVQRYLSIASTLFKSDRATTLKTTGITQSNGSASFTYNTTVDFDVLNYMTTYTQSGNTTFSIKQKNKVTQAALLPNYPLSFYKSRCTNYSGAVNITDTSPAYNKCIYAKGDVTFNTTTATGKITIVSEGYIKDKSTNSTLQPWDTTNGILFYSAKGYTSTENGAKYTGVIYAPTANVNGGFSNTTLNGALFAKNVNFNTGTSLTANQAAGFPTTTYSLPL